MEIYTYFVRCEIRIVISQKQIRVLLFLVKKKAITLTLKGFYSNANFNVGIDLQIHIKNVVYKYLHIHEKNNINIFFFTN